MKGIVTLVEYCTLQYPREKYDHAFRRAVRGDLPGAVRREGRWYVDLDAVPSGAAPLPATEASISNVAPLQPEARVGGGERRPVVSLSSASLRARIPYQTLLRALQSGAVSGGRDETKHYFIVESELDGLRERLRAKKPRIVTVPITKAGTP